MPGAAAKTVVLEPDGDKVAIVVDATLQLPPLVVELKVVVLPMHRLIDPLIASGKLYIVISVVLKHPPTAV